MNAAASFAKTLAVACTAAALLAGCVVAPVGPYGSPYGGAYRGPQVSGEVVTLAPPAPRYEVIGIAPVVGQVWIAGYWGWAGGGYNWVPGYWSAPRPGYVWSPHAWERHGQGWRMNPGHWRRY